MENIYESFSSPETGNYGKHIGDLLYGINHRNAGYIVNTISQGDKLIFFTRPHFNMQKGNLRNDRTMTNLITDNPNSVQSFIRQTLDPSLQDIEKNACKLLDNNCAFIPVLTNTLKSISGWPDRILPTFASKPGARGEQHSIPDGITEINGKTDLTLTFEKMDGDINERLLEVWMEMMSLQVDGMVVPYSVFEVLTEMNFNTRIYVLDMDVTKRIVMGIGVANACFPVNDNIGRKFDYNKNQNNKDMEFSIRFEANTIIYNDPITLLEFNKVGGMFNLEVYNHVENGFSGLSKISQEDLYKYNYRGYPLINMETMELEWYV